MSDKEVYDVVCECGETYKSQMTTTRSMAGYRHVTLTKCPSCDEDDKVASFLCKGGN